MGLILNGSYRGELLTTLVNLYKGHSTPDFVQMSQCLIFLDEPLAVADVLEKLSNGNDAPIPIKEKEENPNTGSHPSRSREGLPFPDEVISS